MTEGHTLNSSWWKTTILGGLFSAAIMVLFWWPFFTGKGLIGGDLYSYYFPQKQYLAEQLAKGSLPLWNHRVGHGYPIIAESQTGLLYPPHLFFYSFFELETAYYANQLFHYWLTFLFAFLFAGKIGLKFWGASLAALVYTYGWFPPRICLEWAIIGGMYLPLGLYLLESFLQTNRIRFLVLLSIVLAVQLCAGHFQLAFIHLIVLCCYSMGRLFWTTGLIEGEEQSGPDSQAIVHGRSLRKRKGTAIFISLCLGMILASPQLICTWKLSKLSQRMTVEGEFEPASGHIPPLYFSQLVCSWWYWYSPNIDLDNAIRSLTVFSVPYETNKVEAHFFLGSFPLIFLLVGCFSFKLVHRRMSRTFILIGILSLCSLFYATGWLMPMAKHLPGFRFFRGAGRYSIVASLGGGLLAGLGMQSWLASRKRIVRFILPLTIILVTATEFWYVSRVVTYAVFQTPTALSKIEESELFHLLQKADHKRKVRVYAGGANLLTALGVSQTPVYLGLGPAEYFAKSLTFPQEPLLGFHQLSQQQIHWLEKAGVTHLVGTEPFHLNFQPNQNTNAIDNSTSSENAETNSLKLLWSGPDAFLNRAWGQHPQTPCYLYELLNSRGGVTFLPHSPDGGNSSATATKSEELPVIVEHTANKIVLETNTKHAGKVLLTELMYPGWRVLVDGKEAKGVSLEKMYRGVEVSAGRHRIEWLYQPVGLKLGFILSGIGIVLLIWLPILYRRPKRLF